MDSCKDENECIPLNSVDHNDIPNDQNLENQQYIELLYGDIGQNNWNKAIRRIQRDADNFSEFSCLDVDCKNIIIPKKWNILQYACKIENEKEATETVRRILDMSSSFISSSSSDELEKFVNNKDFEKRTALHIAISKNYQQIVEDLLLHRADINLVAENDMTDALGKIYDRLHRVLVKLYDNGFKVRKGEYDPLNDQLWEVECDFTPVTGIVLKHENQTLKLQETRLLATVLAQARVKRADILLHPLVQIFLHLKGNKYKWFILTSVLYHLLWSVFCVWFFVTNNLESGSNVDKIIVSIILIIVSVTKEATELYICPSLCYYFNQYENRGQWLVIIIVAFETILSFFPDLNSVTSGLRVIGIVTAIHLVQGQSTKFECVGIYNHMLIRSFRKLLRFLLAFSPMLFAYLYTFSLILPELPEFNFNNGSAIVKIMVMLTGEIEYNGIFHPDEPRTLPHPALTRILLLLFIISVVILLQNLLISITVADYEKLKQKCKTSHLGTRLEVIFLIERFLTNYERTRKFMNMESRLIGNKQTKTIKLIDLPHKIQKEIKAYTDL